MAYSRVWDETFPPDTQAAKLLGQDIRQFKQDTRERVSSFAAGLLADRPTPEAVFTGVIYIATDSKQMFRWNGASWDDITNQVLGTAVWGSITGNIDDQTDVAKKNSPAFTGTPTAPTPATSDNTTKLATTAFVLALLGTFVSDFSGPNGYVKFPFFNNFTIQWAQGTNQGPGEGSQTINWPIAFAVECLSAQVSMITSGVAANDCWYQITAMSASSITVYKQSTGGSTQNSTPMVLGIGH